MCVGVIDCKDSAVVLQPYRVLDQMGEGTYGIVLRCLHKATGAVVAIKQFEDSDEPERVCQYVNSLSRVPNVSAIPTEQLGFIVLQQVE